MTAAGRSPPNLRGGVLGAYLPIASAFAAALFAWWGRSYWSYSDGVYLFTAGSLDAGIYSDVAAAQPPLLFWFGAGILSVQDSVLAVRGVLAALMVGTGWLVALAVWRITASRPGAVLAGFAGLLTPWRLHDALTLTPESLGAPLLLAAALLCARPGRPSILAGGIAGIAACVKLGFVLPAAALILGAAARERYVAGAACAAAVVTVLSLALYGEAVFENVFTAQRQTGARDLAVVAPLLAQAAWNLAPLLLLAAVAWRLREHLGDPSLLRALAFLLAGQLVLVATTFKEGTSLNLIAVIEPAALVLAASGTVALLRHTASRRSAGAIGTRAAAATCILLLAGQSASLLLSPSNPELFARPLSALAYQRLLSADEVEAMVERARRCPPGVPYSGVPYIAFMAERPMPGGQPDQFIVARARVHGEKRGAAAVDFPRCP